MSDTLVLNADGAPITYLPLSVIDWQEAIRYMVLEKVHVLNWHDNWIVHSHRWSTPVPAVIMLKEFMKPKQTVRFSRGNVYLRDLYRCSYCSHTLQKKDCTLDHVLPVSKGGKTTFENTVTSCGPCNAAKGNNHRVRPKVKPYRPSYFELVNKRKQFPFMVRHESWREFLS
jgi:5-methylcytosine-specific restriction endonuclease McrA